MAAFEVIALDTATPQLRAPGASDTYTFPRAVEMPLGTANGVLYLNGSKVVTSGSGLTFDSSGNLGLGVTPSAWSAASRAIQLPNGAALANEGSVGTFLGSNWYRSSSGNTYIQNGFSTLYGSTNGQHIWYTAPSGTAGNAISFTQAMTLAANGDLSVGTTDTTAVRFKVQAGSEPIVFLSGFSGAGTMGVVGANPLAIYTNGSERARIPAAGGMVVGTAALATTATNGFLYVPTCAGTPTGTPTTQTGTAPIVVDTTNHKLYFYSGGAWRDAGP